MATAIISEELSKGGDTHIWKVYSNELCMIHNGMRNSRVHLYKKSKQDLFFMYNMQYTENCTSINKRFFSQR